MSLCLGVSVVRNSEEPPQSHIVTESQRLFFRRSGCAFGCRRFCGSLCRSSLCRNSTFAFRRRLQLLNLRDALSKVLLQLCNRLSIVDCRLGDSFHYRGSFSFVELELFSDVFF